MGLKGEKGNEGVAFECEKGEKGDKGIRGPPGMPSTAISAKRPNDTLVGPIGAPGEKGDRVSSVQTYRFICNW